MGGARPRYLVASGVLHAGLLACAMIAWPFMARPLRMTVSTPVTIVSKGPADLKPAAKAPEAQTAAAPIPAEEPAPAPPPPQEPTPAPAARPRPRPAPPPTPEPAPEPEPAPPPRPALKPAVRRPSPDRPEARPPAPAKAPPVAKPAPAAPSLDLDQLAAAAPKAHARSGALDLGALAAADAKPARARATVRGPPRPETDLLARLAAGRATGLSADALGALQAKLNRLWHPNCEVEGGGGVIVKIGVRLTPDGRLIGQPSLVSQSASGASQAVVEASAGRALSAVRQGEPYTEIPRDAPHDLVLQFDAKTACRR